MTAGRRVPHATAVVLILIAPALPAQSPFCFRGRPLPKCGAFAIFEVTGAKRLVGTTHLAGFPPSQYSTEDLGNYLSWTLGAMSNRDTAHAVGGTLDFGYQEGWRVAVKARRRTWYPEQGSVDLSAGAIVIEERTIDPGHTPAYGITTEAALGSGDVAALTLGADVTWASSDTHPRAAIHGGLHLGSYAALGATALMIVSVATIALGLSHNDF